MASSPVTEDMIHRLVRGYIILYPEICQGVTVEQLSLELRLELELNPGTERVTKLEAAGFDC